MIKEDNVIQEWEVYSATQFQKEFNIKEKWNEQETDEDYIYRHLQEDERMFRVIFMEDPRDNSYEEYWLIQLIE